MTNSPQFTLTQNYQESGLVLVPAYEEIDFKSSWLPDHKFDRFQGKRKQIYQTYLSENAQNVYLLGLGNQGQQAAAHQVFRNFATGRDLTQSLLVDLRSASSELIFQCVLGLSLSDYNLGLYKTDRPSKTLLSNVQLLVSQVDAEMENQVGQAVHTAQAIKGASQLVDAPANIKTPQFLGQWAVNSGKEHGYQVELLEENEIKKQNLYALAAVGQGSEHAPVLIKAIYQHPDLEASDVQLGLVGKGVTFDTGGISLKKPANMHYMKSDMGGAAAVLGAIELIARLKLKLKVVAIIPVAENSIDALSIRPGDVIQSYSGKSIEIIDTDAEGRLILADALSYIQQNHAPQTLIDLATLTGSCVAALGYEAAGLFSNDQQVAAALEKSGNRVGERVWRLPLWDSYGDALDSDVADVKNLSGKPVAGAITAAKFLEYFVQENQSWAHLDIAGVAFGDTDHAKMKSATGYGVQLLVDFAKTLI